MEEKKIPQCVGFILDGNRRWAKEQGLPTYEGHKEGYSKLKEVISWCKEAQVKNVIVYALSTENWNRSKTEVSYLMELFRTVLQDEFEKLSKENLRIIFAGDLSRFPDDLQNMMKDTEEKTKDFSEGTLVVAASYGGRAEILNAANSFIKEGRRESVTEEEFATRLWTRDIPDPDIIVRTGEAMRLSNFLPWQSVYSELYFTDTYWPDFSREEFEHILEEYSERERRMGK